MQITNNNQRKTGKRVALGMSGGVDSSVCAYLLKDQGYEVTGVYLECWRAPGCRTEEDRKDALNVALGLEIPFQVLDFKQQYKDKVVEYFFDEYQAGRTPNPDVLCNKEIKFGMFYDWAMEQGFDYVATGHYARIDARSPIPDSSKTVPTTYNLQLTTSCDSKKDQTYFLYRLRQEQLDHILFPIGHLTKTQVREEATKRKIPVADKPDSQGICFIGEINVHNFLKERLGENPGQVINTSGEVIGSHNGLWFYTVGQRHGFEILGSWKSQLGELKRAMPPYYVIKKIPETNQLMVGFGAETYRSEFEVQEVHFIDERFQFPDSSNILLSEISNLESLYVRIRHGGKLIPCKLSLTTNHQALITLSEPTQGIAEGQSAVFYCRTGEQSDWANGEGEKMGKSADSHGSTEYRLPNTEPSYICLGGGVIG